MSNICILFTRQIYLQIRIWSIEMFKDFQFKIICLYYLTRYNICIFQFKKITVYFTVYYNYKFILLGLKLLLI